MTLKLYIFLCFYLNNVVLSNIFDHYGSNRSSNRDSLIDNKEVLLISTLNGNFYGIDVNDGELLWTIFNGPLVSQSLSNLEFVKDGKKFRLIPSLEGQLYMLDIDNDKKGLHALPITADSLFTSSFQLSSDSMLVGGKEQRVVGFNPITGEIKYHCGKDGCHQGPTFRPEKESCDLLLCRRINNIVRAFDIESGQEKWNFSVGQDEVLTANTAFYPKSPMDGFVEESILTKNRCIMSTEDVDDNSIQWSFNVERGVVQAASRAPFSIVRWQKELGSSLSRVWLLRGKTVHPLSIFTRDAHSHLEHSSDESGCPIRRSLFLGSHDGQMYVQLEDGNARRSPRPAYVALSSSSSSSRADSHSSSSKTDLDIVTTTRHRMSKVTRYIPPLQYGFFQPSMKHDESDLSKNWFTFQDNNECYPYVSDPLVVRFGSFLFQKVMFACLVLIVLHLVFKKLYLPYQMAKLQNSISVDKLSAMTVSDSNNNALSSSVSLQSSLGSLDTPQFHVSRYETDFEHIRCLGRGAFGVVFEARHRVDQFSYAVKRVRVRYSPQARDKLLQEVQAFAHLEHPGIVRYYQAWFELPPKGWQEQRDRDLSLTVIGDSAGASISTGVTRSDSSVFSLTCGDPDNNDWSTVSVGDRSREPRIDGDSLVIFDRSVSATRPWALQLSSSSGTSSDSGEGGLDTPSQTAPIDHFHDISATRASPGTAPTDQSGDISATRASSGTAPTDQSGDISATRASSGTAPTDLPHNISAKTAQCPVDCSHIYLFISMQLYSGTTLQHRLQQPLDQRPTRDALLAIFAQIIDAVAYLHRKGLMHRDLKPSNILFDTDSHIRIVDFGLATPLVRTKPLVPRGAHSRDGLHTSNVGTELYMSPEQQKGSQYDEKVDIFALGIIFLELMLPLTTGTERFIVLTNARKLKFDEDTRQKYENEVSFASQLLSHDPKDRPTCEQILSHDILASVLGDGGTPLSKSRSISFNI